jgi:peptidoglycan/LPS O-acetylase OafA/YrhL
MTDQALTHSPLKYRPAIDGVRALAVGSVFVFHLNRRWLPGGFVGVDVFFVISGYLITSLILKDLGEGAFSLRRFFQRRIARIFPAFFVVALGTLAGAALIYLPVDLGSAGSSLAAASLSAANLKYMVQGNYFKLSPDAQPYLHYWSLSVEEQYYLLFPLALSLGWVRVRRRLAVIVASAATASFLACVVVTQRQPVWAFYLLPTRAWELLTGALLALYAPRLLAIRGRWMEWIPGAGLVLVALSFSLTREGDHFPGFWALLPVIGTAAVLIPRPNAGICERWLSAPPLVLIGQMSYSLYLWHWPVFSMVDYRLYLSSAAARLAIKIALSLPLAYLSFRFLEGPARAFLSRSENSRLAYAVLGCALVVTVPLGLGVRRTQFVEASPEKVASGGVVFDSGIRNRSVVLMGDSNASMYGALLRDLCIELGCRLTVLSVSGGDPLPRVVAGQQSLWLDSLAVVRREKPDILVLGCAWTSRLQDQRERLALGVEQLLPHVGHLVILSQPPQLPEGASRAAIREGARPPFFEDASVRSRRLETREILERFASSKVSVVDVASRFEAVDGSIVLRDSDGHQLFQDAGHLSGFGAERVRPEFRNVISTRVSAAGLETRTR